MSPSNGPIERALANAIRNAPSQQTSLSVSDPQPPDHWAPSSDTTHSRRRVHVSRITDRYIVTKWMVDHATTSGEANIISKAVRQFPQHFPGNTKANFQKASRWWRNRIITMGLKEPKKRNGLFVATGSRGTKISHFKALKGRGRKRERWVTELYKELLSEFEMLRAAGLKFSTAVIRDHAIRMVIDAPQDSPYHRSLVETNKLLHERISIRWVQHFMHANGIVLRAQTGKLMVSPEKELLIEKEVAFHLDELKRGFQSGLLNESRIENADETHFVFNMDNGKTLGFIGDKHVKYADVASGGEPITMMVRLTGGPSARIEPPMLIFKNVNRSYPIRGLGDDVPGVCYRTGPKGWMDSYVFCQWLSEPRVIKTLPNGDQRVLYVDNCSSHNSNVDVKFCLRNIRTTMQHFPANATHLVQPAVSFIIQKIKEAWRVRWDKYKYDAIRNGDWLQTSTGEGSGKLRNPGKKFFLKLAAEAVRDVNKQRDKDGVQYARKAMIMTGMSLNLNGLWEEEQLTDDLQQLIAKHRNHFDGEPVKTTECVRNDETTESE